MEVIYRAIDGTEFNNQNECIKYEISRSQEFKNTMDGIIVANLMFDAMALLFCSDHVIITSENSAESINDKLIKCNAIYCPTYEARDALIKFCDFYSLIGSDKMGTGWNIYNEDIEEYIPFTNIDSISEFYKDDRMIDALKKKLDDIYRQYY